MRDRHRHRRRDQVGAVARNDEVDLVDVEQLCIDARHRSRVALVVVVDELDRPAQQSAFGVDVVPPDLHRRAAPICRAAASPPVSPMPKPIVIGSAARAAPDVSRNVAQTAAAVTTRRTRKLLLAPRAPPQLFLFAQLARTKAIDAVRPEHAVEGTPSFEIMQVSERLAKRERRLMLVERPAEQHRQHIDRALRAGRRRRRARRSALGDARPARRSAHASRKTADCATAAPGFRAVPLRAAWRATPDSAPAGRRRARAPAR